ncbi:type II toxin-antitoxin system HigA family antitoxin [Maribacter sp. 4G9]|uniref:helix-turn-helix domain-containing protein n=1 Tax=Maribacter sp. 4G9 TaxID=1889777 RepID=UPI000C1499F6|nr:helix-turn-helix domain-containing protein [Maribacter sp. 4G9]PIB27869.1 DNA-binding protein [Maribacter sp. 4G9]
MEIKIIKSENQYRQYLERFNKIFDAEEGTPESDEFDLLALVIEKYENEHYHIEEPHPLEAIRFMMEQNGISEGDLGKIINSRSRVSELFSGTRKLTLNHIRAINKRLHVPADILIKDYEVGETHHGLSA